MKDTLLNWATVKFKTSINQKTAPENKMTNHTVEKILTLFITDMRLVPRI